jgi:hypothetical protein
VIGPRRRDVSVPGGHLPGAGRAEPDRRAVPRRGFARWWATTAADRFLKIPAAALDHRKFWDAMHAVYPWAAGGDLAPPGCGNGTALPAGLLLGVAGHDQLRHLHRYRDEKTPLPSAAKPSRNATDLRLIGLGLVVASHDGGIRLPGAPTSAIRPTSLGS